MLSFTEEALSHKNDLYVIRFISMDSILYGADNIWPL